MPTASRFGSTRWPARRDRIVEEAHRQIDMDARRRRRSCRRHRPRRDATPPSAHRSPTATTRRDGLPSVAATRPTPQASPSNSGRYMPSRRGGRVRRHGQSSLAQPFLSTVDRRQLDEHRSSPASSIARHCLSAMRTFVRELVAPHRVGPGLAIVRIRVIRRDRDVARHEALDLAELHQHVRPSLSVAASVLATAQACRSASTFTCSSSERDCMRSAPIGISGSIRRLT